MLSVEIGFLDTQNTFFCIVRGFENAFYAFANRLLCDRRRSGDFCWIEMTLFCVKSVSEHENNLRLNTRKENHGGGGAGGGGGTLTVSLSINYPSFGRLFYFVL